MSYASYKNLGETGIKLPKPSDKDNTIHITSIEQKNELIQNNRLCVVDIYADFCGPCKTVGPKYSLLALKYNKPSVCVLTKENSDLQLSDNVGGVPCFHFYQNGKFLEKETIIGGDIRRIEEKIVQLLN